MDPIEWNCSNSETILGDPGVRGNAEWAQIRYVENIRPKFHDLNEFVVGSGRRNSRVGSYPGDSGLERIETMENNYYEGMVEILLED